MPSASPDATCLALVALCGQYLRAPDGYATDAATGAPLLTFTPALSAAEQATLSDLTAMARFGVQMTLAEWQQVKPDAALLKQFLGIASPTNAQAVAAVKSIIRVLGVIVRS